MRRPIKRKTWEALYRDQSLSYVDIALRTKCRLQYVYENASRLKLSYLRYKRTGPPKPKRVPAFKAKRHHFNLDEVGPQIRAMVETGVLKKDIQKHFGIGQCTLDKLFRRLGISLRYRYYIKPDNPLYQVIWGRRDYAAQSGFRKYKAALERTSAVVPQPDGVP